MSERLRSLTRPLDMRCSSCCCDPEYYMVHDHVWQQATAEWPASFLCFCCLEIRIGRRLTIADFTHAPINRPIRWGLSLADREIRATPA